MPSTNNVWNIILRKDEMIKWLFLFFFLFVPFHRIPYRVFTNLFPVPPYHSLPLSYLTAGASAEDLATLHRISLGHGETAENPCRCSGPYIFFDSTMPAIKESEELSSRSMADVQVSAPLSGHPSKSWLRATLLDFGDSRSRALTAHLPLSVYCLFITNAYRKIAFIVATISRHFSWSLSLANFIMLNDLKASNKIFRRD